MSQKLCSDVSLYIFCLHLCHYSVIPNHTNKGSTSCKGKIGTEDLHGCFFMKHSMNKALGEVLFYEPKLS